MNRHKSSIDLGSNSQPREQPPERSESSTSRHLELPFEKTTPKRLPSRPEPPAVYPYLDNLNPSSLAKRNTDPALPRPTKAATKTRSSPSSLPLETRSLYYALDEIEDRLARRLYRLQKRLVAVERKIEFQQRFLVVIALLWLGFAYLALVRLPDRSLSPSPAPTEQQFAPQLQPT